MVKQIVIEETDVGYLKQFTESPRCHAGLIIGRTTNNKDYIVRLVKCPTQMIGEKSKEWNAVKDVDGSWVAGHASQVIPSLPGGISIIGLFVVATSADSKLAMEKLKNMLYQTYKLATKTSQEIESCLSPLSTDNETIYWTIMHVDSKSGAVVSSRQYDVKDNKDSGRPVDVKQTDVQTRWDCVETTLHVDNTFVVPSGRQLFGALKTFCKKIGHGHVVMDGTYRQGSELLNQSSSAQTGKGSKKKKPAVKITVGKIYHCQIFIPSSKQTDDKFDNERKSVGEKHMLHTSGSIAAKAYLVPGSTIAEVTYALKYDIVQSLYQRCNILSEDTSDSDSVVDSSPKSLPRRVFIKDDQKENGILYSEYVLPDELPEDCLERFKDNLDLNADSDQLLETNCLEKFGVPDTTQESISSQINSDRDDFSEPISGATRTNAIVALVATAVATVAWMFSGLFISEH